MRSILMHQQAALEKLAFTLPGTELLAELLQCCHCAM